MFKPIDALSVLCAQLTRDLLAIAKFLLKLGLHSASVTLYTREKGGGPPK